MKLNRTTLTHAAVCTVILGTALLALVAIDYIDLSVIASVHVPVYAVVLVILLFGQYVVGYFLAASAAVGLIAEYVVHTVQTQPTMGGAFLNIAIVLFGLVTGIVIQVVVHLLRQE